MSPIWHRCKMTYLNQTLDHKLFHMCKKLMMLHATIATTCVDPKCVRACAHDASHVYARSPVCLQNGIAMYGRWLHNSFSSEICLCVANAFMLLPTYLSRPLDHRPIYRCKTKWFLQHGIAMYGGWLYDSCSFEICLCVANALVLLPTYLTRRLDHRHIDEVTWTLKITERQAPRVWGTTTAGLDSDEQIVAGDRGGGTAVVLSHGGITRVGVDELVCKG